MAVVITHYDETGILGIEAVCAVITDRVTAEVADDARRACPVDDGDLLASIDTPHVADPLKGRVKVGTQYWDMLEYGGVLGAHTEGPYPPTIRKTDEHSHMDAQPFMRPALWRKRVI